MEFKYLNTWYLFYIINKEKYLLFLKGITLLMMGTADALPTEPAEKPVFVEDMSEQQLASAVSS